MRDGVKPLHSNSTSWWWRSHQNVNTASHATKSIQKQCETSRVLDVDHWCQVASVCLHAVTRWSMLTFTVSGLNDVADGKLDEFNRNANMGCGWMDGWMDSNAQTWVNIIKARCEHWRREWIFILYKMLFCKQEEIRGDRISYSPLWSDSKTYCWWKAANEILIVSSSQRSQWAWNWGKAVSEVTSAAVKLLQLRLVMSNLQHHYILVQTASMLRWCTFTTRLYLKKILCSFVFDILCSSMCIK